MCNTTKNKSYVPKLDGTKVSKVVEKYLIEDMFRQIGRVGHVELRLVLQQRQLPIDAAHKRMVSNLG